MYYVHKPTAFIMRVELDFFKKHGKETDIWFIGWRVVPALLSYNFNNK
jgi:hypothetical protein